MRSGWRFCYECGMSDIVLAVLAASALIGLRLLVSRWVGLR